jgi:hypothetical protein
MNSERFSANEGGWASDPLFGELMSTNDGRLSMAVDLHSKSNQESTMHIAWDYKWVSSRCSGRYLHRDSMQRPKGNVASNRDKLRPANMHRTSGILFEDSIVQNLARTIESQQQYGVKRLLLWSGVRRYHLNNNGYNRRGSGQWIIPLTLSSVRQLEE